MNVLECFNRRREQGSEGAHIVSFRGVCGKVHGSNLEYKRVLNIGIKIKYRAHLRAFIVNVPQNFSNLL